jgi:FO synthase
LSPDLHDLFPAARAGDLPDDAAARQLAEVTDLDALMDAARAIRDAAFGDVVTFSKKVFIPLTHLCRDACGYCTFAKPPRRGEAAYLSPEQVLAIARAGQAAGCAEALFTLGDKPELKWRNAAEELARLGHPTTLHYLAAMAKLAAETGLLPHLNPGLMTATDLTMLRPVAASMGIMLETVAERLSERGGPHFGAPDKLPAARLATIAAAGEAKVPFTSGILIGIGETRLERIEALLALRDLHRRYGHLQEVIIQNFRAKPDTRMANAPEPDTDDLLWTIAVARIVFGGTLTVQAPPNLQEPGYGRLIDAGIDDWGGVSPVTPDHVNPERPWPHLEALAAETAKHGKVLTERLAVHRAYALDSERWIDPALRPRVLAMSDAEGLRRVEAWRPGIKAPLPETDLALLAAPAVRRSDSIGPLLGRAAAGKELSEAEIVQLFAARGPAFADVCRAADAVRREAVGDSVSYAVVRNINYTNICYFRCGFCAFSKGKLAANLRGEPYDLGIEEIARRAREAWERGATEVCMQGGIHPDYTGKHYLDIARAVKQAVPGMHVHAFSPLEIWHGATTLKLSIEDYLAALKEAGLGSLPGTAAEVLDDEVRDILCPDKVSTQQWLDIMRAAHKAGIRSTATIMYGHVDRPVHWARHLLRLRHLQIETGGFTELVPLPFVAGEAPIALKGRSRMGPSFREAVLMHAVGRLALHPHFKNVQTSWVKMGADGARICLEAGANDMGGTLMNESITRAAGAEHGEELPPAAMEALIRGLGRAPRIRTTLYGDAGNERRVAAFDAAPLAPIKLEVAAHFTGELTESDRKRSLPRPRTAPARISA